MLSEVFFDAKNFPLALIDTNNFNLNSRYIPSNDKLPKSNTMVNSLEFDGLGSYVEIPPSETLRDLTNNSFTWSILVNPYDNFDVPMYLIGDLQNRKYIHNYILGRIGYQMGFAYDNSRAFSFSMYDFKNKMIE